MIRAAPTYVPRPGGGIVSEAVYSHELPEMVRYVPERARARNGDSSAERLAEIVQALCVRTGSRNTAGPKETTPNATGRTGADERAAALNGVATTYVPAGGAHSRPECTRVSSTTGIVRMPAVFS
ncbi:hypothetical protein GCM10010151_25360 [Actinoallomurus spadix]|uniref:Uncharacterized protein n=1 Tax=Actinoallomurus spadix TaxID=79912 RepID=A0ABN0WEG8_9ACTN